MPIDATESRFAPARRATTADGPALVRLRALMLEEMGVPAGGPESAWWTAAELWFTERLQHPGQFAAFVIDDSELGVVSSAVGTCDQHAPSPANVSGLHGHLFNVSTDPRRRGLGHARACMGALLLWFQDETPVGVVDLNATQSGAGLYRSLGFDAPRHPALRLRMRHRPGGSQAGY